MAVQPEAEASVDADRTSDIGKRIAELPREFVDVNHRGNNMQYQIDGLVREISALDERRRAILKELRDAIQPPDSDVLMFWGR